MINSTCYYRNCKLEEYHNRLIKLEDCIKNYKVGDRLKLKLCSMDDTIITPSKSNALQMLKSDYHDKKCKLSSGTLFDLCIRDNASSFKSVFSDPGTRNTLIALYMYIDSLPKRIRIRNKSLSDLSELDSYYVKYYINLYLPYDLITILLENYTESDTMDKLIFLEGLLDNMFDLLERNFNLI